MKSYTPFIVLFLIGMVMLIGARLLIVRVVEDPKKKKEQKPKDK